MTTDPDDPATTPFEALGYHGPKDRDRALDGIFYLKLQRATRAHMRAFFKDNPDAKRVIGYPTTFWRDGGWRVWPKPAAGMSIVYEKGVPHSVCVQPVVTGRNGSEAFKNLYVGPRAPKPWFRRLLDWLRGEP